ncbi:kallikrein-14-like [Eublepharis macularius]|uniref:Kallikrein-14-like n=1 Tax=Eublepharis macularius TaxID=481883 RepID=A0AA97KEX8_EUBMA|nr:kallikrein-14-like [Eublepharis macularius]
MSDHVLIIKFFAGCAQDDEGRIIGGYPCIPHSQPWQAYVTGQYICGGTLIAPGWVLTAAHCLSRNMVVRLGEHNLHYWDGIEQIRRVVRAIRHPQYDTRTLNNDIMLLKMDRPVSLSRNIRPLRLPFRCSSPGTPCLVSGWGTVSSPQASFPNVLQCANVRLFSRRYCESSYPGLITKNMICAGILEGGVDSCQGDSGGPLVCRGQLEGIVSWGMETCAQSKYPGVYTRVCNYKDWVNQVIRWN